MENSKQKRSAWGMCLLFLVILVGLFDASLYWMEGTYVYHKIIVLAVNLTGLLVIPVLLWVVPPVSQIMQYCVSRLKEKIRLCLEHKKRIGCILLLFAVLSGATALVMIAASQGEAFPWWKYYFFTGCVWLSAALFLMRKQMAEKTERVFAVTALILGMTFILSSPNVLGVGWDDETHYVRSISLVSMFDSVKYGAENQLIADHLPWYERICAKNFSYEEFKAYSQGLDQLYEEKIAGNQEVLLPYDENTQGYKSLGGIYSVAYVVPAIGIILGKGLHLSFTHIFMLGRMSILLAYTLIVYFAIKRLRYGKLLMTVIALLPTSLFLASMYSYDWWVISLTMAGVSYYLSVMQRPERKFSWRELFMMLVCFVLGVLPKWVYGVMLLPILFFPGDKFANRKQRRLWYGLLCVGFTAAFCAFIVPFLIQGPGVGDLRGGEGINAGVQLWWMLHQPLRYLKKMVGFILTYLGLNGAPLYTTNLGYLGQGNYGVLLLFVVVLAAFMDRSETPSKRLTLFRISHWVAFFVMTAVLVTVFYIVYTPVGSDVLNGCQGRYLLPLLFPFMYSLGMDGIVIRYNRNRLVFLSVLCIAAGFLYDYYSLFIAYL